MATRVSEMAETLIGSEIIGLAARIRERIERGQKIANLTIGDFDPKLFPIPPELTEEIVRALREGYTNYPAAEGVPDLRAAIASFVADTQGLEIAPGDIVVSAGARPLILATFLTLVDPGDTVVFPVPSWNNNHYTHIARARAARVEVSAAQRFMPTAADLRPHIRDATLLVLCSPGNPTGTTFTAEGLTGICDLVLEENARRPAGTKPLTLLYDQIYSLLTKPGVPHQDPVRLRPEMREHTVFIDGISKSFGATGVRVGWGFGPPAILSYMKPILSHLGAWAPHAEQVGLARTLRDSAAVTRFLAERTALLSRLLTAFYRGFKALQHEGLPVDAVAPEGAIYLTVKIDPRGKKTPAGRVLQTVEDVTAYLLEEAKVALVPFSAFGASADWPWYRLSVGTATPETVEVVIANLRGALSRLS